MRYPDLRSARAADLKAAPFEDQVSHQNDVVESPRRLESVAILQVQLFRAGVSCWWL
jgi:hypothetical protein